jgi:hypothetical protein
MIIAVASGLYNGTGQRAALWPAAGQRALKVPRQPAAAIRAGGARDGAAR